VTDSRLPTPATVALDSFKRDLLRFRELGAQLLHAADDLLASKALLVRDAGLDVRIDVERELRAVLQMRDHAPYWERPVPEPQSKKAGAEPLRMRGRKAVAR
jgi:hypothetical protein